MEILTVGSEIHITERSAFDDVDLGESVITPMTQSEFDNYEQLEAIANDRYNAYASASVYRYAIKGGWNSPLARSIVPDYISFSPGFEVASGVASGHEISFTAITRGKDPGLYFNSTHNMGIATAVEFEVGSSIGYGWTFGDPEQFSSKQLGGWQVSAGAAVDIKAIVGGELSIGVDLGLDEMKKPSTLTRKIGLAVGVGEATPVELSGGIGFATEAKRIIGFPK